MALHGKHKNSPPNPEDNMGVNPFLEILANEGIANEAEGLLENLSNLDFLAQGGEGDPGPCPPGDHTPPLDA